MSIAKRRGAPAGGRLRAVGVIRSELKARSEAPRQGSEGAPDAWLEVYPWALAALLGLSAGHEVVVITWLHRARRDVLQVHPRSDPHRPRAGVFATRSPDRPNPLGLHPVAIRAIDGNRLRVGPMEAIDGTPVVDIKPVLGVSSRGSPSEMLPHTVRDARIAHGDLQVEDWRPDPADAASRRHDVHMLAEVLHAVVHDGAGVSFVVPFSLDEARAFWVQKVLPGVRAGTRRVLIARSGRRIVGTVQIDLAVPPNQQHRAEVAKLLVHPAARRRGIARALMAAVEAVAEAEGRTLLTLDTWTGSHAEALYRSLGYVVVGVIPRYARGSLTPELEPTTIMYKDLRRESGVP